VRADAHEALRAYYEHFRQRHGERPTATEAFHDGYLPRTTRQAHGSWLGFVRAMGDFDAAQELAWSATQTFLAALDATGMTRSFKMLVLQAMLNTDTIPGDGIAIEALAAEFSRLAHCSTRLQADVGAALEDAVELRRLLEKNPIAAWTGNGAVPGATMFAYAAGRFRFLGDVPAAGREAFQQFVRELADWRLAEYLDRGTRDAAETGFVMKVSHAGDRPILFLPDRARVPGIPEGWQAVTIDGAPHRANFVQIAVNVVHAEGSEENVLPAILRGWFGPDAGRPGTDFKVKCEPTDAGWSLQPLRRARDD
jgi:hypothetical protein